MKLYCIGSGPCFECSGGAAEIFASAAARQAWIDARKAEGSPRWVYTGPHYTLVLNEAEGRFWAEGEVMA